jgi:hypothetical protein
MMLTRAPSAAKALAQASPMPLPPPVMKACWPWSFSDIKRPPLK